MEYNSTQKKYGYRPPNIERFLEELPERVEAIKKFDKFVERSLKISPKTLEKQINI